MDHLEKRVSDFVADNDLWQTGASLLLAVSGGPDSLCMLHLLLRSASRWNFRLHIAHLDHGLRPESEADAQWVAALAAEWGVPCTVTRREVHARASEYGGIEAAARAVRYGFLRDTAIALGVDAVATAHHADDQAETVMLRLLRGAGPTGLAGMRPRLDFARWSHIGATDRTLPPSGPALVRPLLSIPRTAIDAYCAAHSLSPRHDPTNQSPDYLRNRVRGHIIPELKAYNSNIVAVLGRTARICAEEDELIGDLVATTWQALAQVSEQQVRLDQTRFMEVHRAVQRRLLRRVVAEIAPTVQLSADHLDRMVRLAGQRFGRLQLPGFLGMRVSKNMIVVEHVAEG